MKPLPAHLPPLPENAVYLGTGGSFTAMGPEAEFNGWAASRNGTWGFYEGLIGNDERTYYAAPKDRPIALLNGEPEIDWKKRAEEWEKVAEVLYDLLKRKDAPATPKQAFDYGYEKADAFIAYEALKSKDKP